MTKKYVTIDPRFYRPSEVHTLLGDATKAYTTLGWEPKITFRELVQKMVDYDLSILPWSDEPQKK